MKLIVPNKNNLIQSSVAEDDAPTWSSSTTYAKDAKVVLEHRVYQSLKDSNTNHKPIDTLNGIDAWWRDLGATNQWKMFDDAVASQTLVTGEGEQKLTVKVRFDRATSFALLNVSASHVAVSITEDGADSPYWERSFEMIKSVGSWWRWFFDEIEYVKDIVNLDIPTVYRGELTVVLSGITSVGIGLLVVGKQRQVGATLYGINASMKSYSRKDTDDFGNTKLVKRRNAKRHNGELYLHPNDYDRVYTLLAEMDSIPAVWIGDNRDSSGGGLQSLSVYGWIEDFGTSVVGPNEVRIDVTIQGLV